MTMSAALGDIRRSRLLASELCADACEGLDCACPPARWGAITIDLDTARRAGLGSGSLVVGCRPPSDADGGRVCQERVHVRAHIHSTICSRDWNDAPSMGDELAHRRGQPTTGRKRRVHSGDCQRRWVRDAGVFSPAIPGGQGRGADGISQSVSNARLDSRLVSAADQSCSSTVGAAASPASTKAAAAPEPSAPATDAAADPLSQTGSAVPTGWLAAAGVIIVGRVGLDLPHAPPEQGRQRSMIPRQAGYGRTGRPAHTRLPYFAPGRPLRLGDRCPSPQERPCPASLLVSPPGPWRRTRWRRREPRTSP